MEENVTKLSIIIPAFNEAQTILMIMGRVVGVQLIGNIQKEIILINDCSTDHTEEIFKEFISTHPDADVKYYKHEVHKGKGAAINTGISRASGDYLVILDADLEYDPEEINILLKPVLLGSADVVFGSRFLGGNAHRVLFFWHSIGNKFLTTLSNLFTNLNLTDIETGFKLCKTSIIQNLKLKEKGFGFEPEITAKISRIPGVRIYEVGISYYGRTYKEGKKINWKDGFRAMYCILKYNIFQR